MARLLVLTDKEYTTARKIEQAFLTNFLLGYCGIGQFPNRERHATMERVCGWEGKACFIPEPRQRGSDRAGAESEIPARCRKRRPSARGLPVGGKGPRFPPALLVAVA